jgi:hypothetical protein
MRLLLALVLMAAPLHAAERVFTPQELKADFAALYSGLQAAHYDLYAFTPKAALDKEYQRTLAGLDRPMTLFEAQTRFQLFTAQAHMGHTRVEGQRAAYRQYRAAGGKAFPLQLRIAGDRVYVASNMSGLSTISIGDEILEMNGKPMAQWLARVERHVSAESAYMAGSLLEYDFPLHLWVELGPMESFALKLPNAGHAQVPARTRDEMKAFAAAQPRGLSLEEPPRERSCCGETSSTAANSSRIAHDAEAAGPVSRQYAELYAKAHDGQIVDFEAPFAQPRREGRFAGKVFALIDRQSYSNARGRGNHPRLQVRNHHRRADFGHGDHLWRHGTVRAAQEVLQQALKLVE